MERDDGNPIPRSAGVWVIKMRMRQEEWKEGRAERMDTFVRMIESSLEKNRVGLEFLSGIMRENPERVRIGRENILIMGNLASYCIPLEELVDIFNNPFTTSGHGMPSVEVHPKWKWLRNHTNACIQSHPDREKPAMDSLAALILSLLDDRNLYMQETQEPFRGALLALYGIVESPISDTILEYVKRMPQEVIYDRFEGALHIKGTHGFVWHLESCDPEVKSYTISSSFRGGPRRIHTEDTWDEFASCKDIDWMIRELAKAPNSMLNNETRLPVRTGNFALSVAKHFAPLRRALSELETENSDGDVFEFGDLFG